MGTRGSDTFLGPNVFVDLPIHPSLPPSICDYWQSAIRIRPGVERISVLVGVDQAFHLTQSALPGRLERQQRNPTSSSLSPGHGIRLEGAPSDGLALASWRPSGTSETISANRPPPIPWRYRGTQPLAPATRPMASALYLPTTRAELSLLRHPPGPVPDPPVASSSGILRPELAGCPTRFRMSKPGQRAELRREQGYGVRSQLVYFVPVNYISFLARLHISKHRFTYWTCCAACLDAFACNRISNSGRNVPRDR